MGTITTQIEADTILPLLKAKGDIDVVPYDTIRVKVKDNYISIAFLLGNKLIFTANCEDCEDNEISFYGMEGEMPINIDAV